jgi:hypothetical protein
MPARWEFRGDVLVVTETGVTSIEEVERVFVAGGLADPRAGRHTRVLWDARASENPLSSDELAWRFERMDALAAEGLISRFALLIRTTAPTIEVSRVELPKVFQVLSFAIFSDEGQALRWLG